MRVADLHHHEFERILLIKPSAVGDVLHTLPVLAKLRARYPSARIDWMLTPHVAELVRHHPALSNVVLFAREQYGKALQDWSHSLALVNLVSQLHRTGYDLVVDLHGQFRSAFFTLATGAATRIGFDRPRRHSRTSARALPGAALAHGWTGAREMSWVAYTNRIPLPTLDAHAVDRYLWLGDLLGFPPGEPEFHVPVPAEARASAERILSRHGMLAKPLAVLAPGTLWETKHWPPDRFAAVARHLLEDGWAVILTGSNKDRSRCREVAELAAGALDLSGRTTLTELAALIRRAGVCVTNDSGPMHLAAALGAPLVSVFGPTDPLWIGPYRRPGAVVRSAVPCSPCYLRKLRECPHGHACMQQVTPQDVIDRVRRTVAANVA